MQKISFYLILPSLFITAAQGMQQDPCPRRLEKIAIAALVNEKDIVPTREAMQREVCPTSSLITRQPMPQSVEAQRLAKLSAGMKRFAHNISGTQDQQPLQFHNVVATQGAKKGYAEIAEEASFVFEGRISAVAKIDDASAAN